MCTTPADAVSGSREKKSNQIYEGDGSTLRRNPGERFRLRQTLCARFAPFLSAVHTGGQRQRIGIARAVLRNSPILVLDEPTAALDTESEKVVMEALERLMQGRTAIIIAHRLSTIRDADKIVVLKGGYVAEEGTHDELIKRNEIYAELYRIQAGATPAPATPLTTATQTKETLCQNAT